MNKEVDIHKINRELASLDKKAATEAKKVAKAKADLLQQLTAVYAELRQSREPVVPIAEDNVANLPHTPLLLSEQEGLGDINLITTPISITMPNCAKVILELSKKLIQKTGGAVPGTLERGVLKLPMGQGHALRARWEIDRNLSVEELHALACVVSWGYEQDIVPFASSKEPKWAQRKRPRKPDGSLHPNGWYGIYLGPDSYYGLGSRGLVVSRKFKDNKGAEYFADRHPIDFLSKDYDENECRHGTVIELWESGIDHKQPGAGLLQEKFLGLTTQVAYLLQHGKLIRSQSLMTTIYRELNRIGARHVTKEELFGMRDTLREIERTLLQPMVYHKRSARLGGKPESLMLAGVLGVGKTFLENYLMCQDYPVNFLPVNVSVLKEALRSKESELLTAVDRITKATGLPVILIIDELDVLFVDSKEGEDLVQKFGDFMNGIHARGLHVITSSNFPWEVDVRFYTPGRISKVVHVPRPNKHDRTGTLGVITRNKPIKNREAVIAWCVEHTDRWTQRHLWELDQEAIRDLLETTGGEDDLSIVDMLTLENYQRAHERLTPTLKLEELDKWDKRIADFVGSVPNRVGF